MVCSCSCGSGCTVTLLHACSGAANTGMLADQVARTLAANGIGSMTCRAAVGADLSGFIVSAGNADRTMVIDGCRRACSAEIFTGRGLPFEHFITSEIGIVRGMTPMTGEVIGTAVSRIAERLQPCP